MPHPIRILLQTTIPPLEDDWHIQRFSLLQQCLGSLSSESGDPLVEVTARDRRVDETGTDPVLAALSRDRFDELWLFALDTGDGLSSPESQAITRFHQQGGGILTTRDHQDMGLSMCGLPTLGLFHYFHSSQNDPDPERCCDDDCETKSISWPNYHSGANGDFQKIVPTEPVHELLKDLNGRILSYFPAHPHEGGVGVPPSLTHEAPSRVIATGVSKITGRPFNLAVAVERSQLEGRIVAQSTFHHFVDYNWDIEAGCPSFVSEAPGDGMKTDPQALADIHAYVRNLAVWLAPE